jgi:hypothetical protein
METQGLAPKPIAVQNSWHALSAPDGGGGGRGGGRGGGARGGRGGGRGGQGPLPTGGDAIAAFRNARGAPPPPRGGGSGGGVKQNGGPAPTANTNSADAAQSWNTYQNRSNLQRARRGEAGVRTLTVEEAIKEIEDKSTAVHTNNIGGRASLWGQWCRRMEDSRIDSDCRYIDCSA